MYSVLINNKGDSFYSVEADGYKISIDAAEKGIKPLSALLASLGACIGVYINKYVKGMGKKLDNLVIRVDAEFSAEKPVYFKKIDVSVELNDSTIEQNRIEAMKRFIHNCPAHLSLENRTEIEVRIK